MLKNICFQMFSSDFAIAKSHLSTRKNTLAKTICKGGVKNFYTAFWYYCMLFISSAFCNASVMFVAKQLSPIWS